MFKLDPEKTRKAIEAQKTKFTTELLNKSQGYDVPDARIEGAQAIFDRGMLEGMLIALRCLRDEHTIWIGKAAEWKEIDIEKLFNRECS